MKNLALTDEVNIEYQKNSKDAVNNHVFGAPSYVLNNEIFWGQDRLDYLEAVSYTHLTLPTIYSV